MQTTTKTIQKQPNKLPINQNSMSTSSMHKQSSVETKFKNWVKSVNWKVETHQVKGYQWCQDRENLTAEQRANNTPYGGIIADEMGLGKTTLIMALLALNNDIPTISSTGANTTNKKTLIVVPAMLIQQWSQIIKSKLDIDPYLFHGNDAKYHLKVDKTKLGDNKIKRDKMNLKVLNEILTNQHVIITTYGMIAMRNLKKRRTNRPDYHCVLWDQHWDRIVFDEAHHMRNRVTGKFMGAFRLGTQQTIRWLVTGTPIQNVVGDLGSLATILGTPGKIHGNSSEKSIKAFSDKYILRRHKTEIDTVLPKLNVEEVRIPWSNENERRVSDVLHANLSFTPVTQDNVDDIMRYLANREYFAMLTRCRQACILPALTQPGFSIQIDHIPDEDILQNLYQRFQNSPIFHTESSKLNTMVQKIKDNAENNHDKIIFCHYRGEMDTLSRRIRAETNLRVSILRGGMSIKARKEALSQNINSNTLFNTLRPVFAKLTSNFPETLCSHILSFIKNDVLIMQIKAGSEGLNLQQYSEVYFSSPHWNPSVEDQALARVHRIGQKKDITVYKFMMDRVCNNSYPSMDEYCNMVQNVKRQTQKKFNLLASSTTQV